MTAVYYEINRGEIPLDQNELRNIILYRWLVVRQHLHIKDASITWLYACTTSGREPFAACTYIPLLVGLSS